MNNLWILIKICLVIFVWFATGCAAITFLCDEQWYKWAHPKEKEHGAFLYVFAPLIVPMFFPFILYANWRMKR